MVGMSHAKRFVRSLFNRAGLELQWANQSPRLNWLGLRQYPIRTVLDIGANHGQFARLARCAFPDATIHSFEPLSPAFAAFSQWAQHQSRVHAYQYAVGDAAGHVPMYRHVEHDPSSSLLATTEVSNEMYQFTHRQEVVRVEQETLDHLVAEVLPPLEDDLLIKVDVQGYEDRVLRGGPETFGRARACIFEASLDHLYEGQATFVQLLNALHEMGFRYAGNLEQDHAARGHVIFLDFVVVREEAHGG